MNYNNDEKALIWLDSFDGISVKKKHNLLEFFQSPSELYDTFFQREDIIVPILGLPTYEKMALAHDDMFLSQYISNLDAKGIQVVTLVSDAYPKLLASIHTPPILLYCKGDISLLKTQCFAIVGTRVPTTYGIDMARKFAKELSQNGFTIVSGLATGIDTNAHLGTLAYDGKAIAVIGGGHDHIYPADNQNLANEIIEKGLIISEYKPNTPNTRYNFPLRNRIIAGLCRGILIVEASNKSGTMHTKEYATSENRDVFCIPGNITSSASAGTNWLIYTQQAHMVLSPEHIFAHYLMEIKVRPTIRKAEQLDMTQQQILDELAVEPRDYQYFIDTLGLDAKTLTTHLVKMEISGKIKKEAGNIYRLNQE